MVPCNWPRACAGCAKLDGILEKQGEFCATCGFYGPDADDVPICHKFMKTMLPCEGCGEWEGGNDGTTD